MEPEIGSRKEVGSISDGFIKNSQMYDQQQIKSHT